MPNKRGRPKLDKHRVGTSISFKEEDLKVLDELAESFGWSRSRTIRYLLRCASQPSNQAMRNEVYNLWISELVLSKKSELVKKPGKEYHTKISFFTTHGPNIKTASQETQETVDQQQNIKSIAADLQAAYLAEMNHWKESGHEELICSFEEWLVENNQERTKTSMPILQSLRKDMQISNEIH